MGCVSNRWLARTRALGAAILAAASVIAPLAQANSSAEMHVRAEVRKLTRLQVLSQPSHVQVTDADIARGYVEVPTAMQVSIRSNTLHGYMLAFDNQADFFRQAHVRGLPNAVQVGASGGMVTQPSLGRGMTEVTVALAFRFDLAQSARAGSYPWPFQLTAEPL